MFVSLNSAHGREIGELKTNVVTGTLEPDFDYSTVATIPKVCVSIRVVLMLLMVMSYFYLAIFMTLRYILPDY